MPRRASTEADYIARIDRVIDHVHVHYAEPLPLDALARIAHFSPFHFHRVFRAHTGETLRAWVSRVRVQRAALLIGRGQTRTTLLEVALACGFGSAAELSRAFREAFHVTPTEFRRRAQTRKNAQESLDRHAYLPRHERHTLASPQRIQRVTRPRCELAYIRVQKPFEGTRLAQAWARLEAFAESAALEGCMRLGLSHDDPELMPEARYDLALAEASTAPKQRGISHRTLEGGLYAELAAHGTVQDIAQAWDALFAWLPTSGYEPADGPGIERYQRAPDFLTWSDFDVVLALPLRPARHAR